MNSLPCRFAALAEDDLDEIATFIAQENPAGALLFIAELKGKCRDIAENPAIYRLREEYGEGVRVTVHGNYLIFHAVRGSALVIERILHGARHLEWVKL